MVFTDFIVVSNSIPISFIFIKTASGEYPKYIIISSMYFLKFGDCSNLGFIPLCFRCSLYLRCASSGLYLSSFINSPFVCKYCALLISLYTVAWQQPITSAISLLLYFFNNIFSIISLSFQVRCLQCCFTIMNSPLPIYFTS